MTHQLLWLPLIFLFPLLSDAAGIYKCTGNARYVAYQNFPCSDGMEQTLMADTPRASLQQGPDQRSAQNASQPPQLAAAALPAHARTQAQLPSGDLSSLPFSHAALKVGMKDDEVLNLPRWGVPDSIMRSKVNGVWHEDWIYRSRSGAAKHLHFQNTVLTSVDMDNIPAQQYASVSLSITR